MKYKIEIDSEACKGCELCIPVCPKQVIAMGEHFNAKGWRFAIPQPDKECTGCKQCTIICPDVAIRILKEE